mmetsp:Transcript_11079/g.28067  ORF Transcript_11079/g.28067 Transcript_11079/m.28067 type:complete len:209 (+) Transcript_11079:467-1093(+)
MRQRWHCLVHMGDVIVARRDCQTCDGGAHVLPAHAHAHAHRYGSCRRPLKARLLLLPPPVRHHRPPRRPPPRHHHHAPRHTDHHHHHHHRRRRRQHREADSRYPHSRQSVEASSSHEKEGWREWEACTRLELVAWAKQALAALAGEVEAAAAAAADRRQHRWREPDGGAGACCFRFLSSPACLYWRHCCHFQCCAYASSVAFSYQHQH